MSLNKKLKVVILFFIFAAFFVSFRTFMDTGWSVAADAFSAFCWTAIFQFMPKLRII